MFFTIDEILYILWATHLTNSKNYDFNIFKGKYQWDGAFNFLKNIGLAYVPYTDAVTIFIYIKIRRDIRNWKSTPAFNGEYFYLAGRV